MLLPVVSWIAALVVVAAVLRSFIHPTRADGELLAGRVDGAGVSGRHWHDGKHSARFGRPMAVIASTSSWLRH
jgi:hypothetical protein